jgi:hypothetical protein
MIRFIPLMVIGLALATPSPAQTGSEILLYDLKLSKNAVILSNPVNITNHPGYDNQPYFHPDEPLVFYSSFDASGRADILCYNFKTKATTHITSTGDREYSPTLTPDKQYLSCIIQRDNGTQDLGKYPVGGGDPYVIIDNLKVGYHVWADNSHIAMFVLGATETDPSTLHYIRLPTKEDTVLASNIGRSLHKIPGERSISFIQRDEMQSKVMRLETETMKVSMLTPTVANGDHVAWTPKRQLLTSDGTILYFLRHGEAPGSWQRVEVKTGAELLKGVTRMAVSAQGNKLAVVVTE